MKRLIGLFLMVGILAISDAHASTSSENRPLAVILLGPPGSGKGTHAVSLSKALELPHVSTGDLFRSHIQNQTSLGLKAKNYMDKGNLVPDELVLDMLFERVSENDCANGYILDGFPRTIKQAHALDQKMQYHHVIALNFQLEDATIIERITGRIACKQCGRPYHKIFDPPQKQMICDECSGPLYQRDDDREEIIRKRLEVYRIQTEPLIEYYAQQKGILYSIDSKNSKEQVFNDCLKVLPLIISEKTKF